MMLNKDVKTALGGVAACLALGLAGCGGSNNDAAANMTDANATTMETTTTAPMDDTGMGMDANAGMGADANAGLTDNGAAMSGDLDAVGPGTGPATPGSTPPGPTNPATVTD